MRILQVDLNKDYSDTIKEAVTVLEAGGVIIYPTDTLYGIGGNALDEGAIRRVFEIKERPFSKPLPMIVKDVKWAKELAFINKKNEVILNKVWPGKTTVILPQKDIIPDILTAGTKTIGMRIADYPLLEGLLKVFGYPIISTSANITGEEPTGDINKIVEIFSARLTKQPDLVLDVGILPKSEPSTILDLTTSKPKILRVGPSKPGELMRLLKI